MNPVRVPFFLFSFEWSHVNLMFLLFSVFSLVLVGGCFYMGTSRATNPTCFLVVSVHFLVNSKLPYSQHIKLLLYTGVVVGYQ